LTASYVDAGVTLIWNAVPGAAYYNIYRSEVQGGGPGATYVALGSSGTSSIRDLNVAPGQTYYYVVTTSADGIESSSSAEVSVIIS
jgi:fibronectin type 3 domain-containing protein